jgi:HPt (histidine-containing phosphotransfer) domain-containing protein
MAQSIDLAQLQMMTSGDAALAVEALGIFRQSAELWSRLLDHQAEAEQWADAAHGIKGAARSIGAMALGDACDTAEKLGRSGMASRVEAAVAISAVKDELGQALEAMAHVEHQLVMRRSFEGVRLDSD